MLSQAELFSTIFGSPPTPRTGGASDRKEKSSGEDPRATGGLVSNLPHPRVNQTKQHTYELGLSTGCFSAVVGCSPTIFRILSISVACTMDEVLQGVAWVIQLIAQQSVWFSIFIVSTLLAGVTLSAWLWRTQARLEALEEAMQVFKQQQQQESSQMLSGKVNGFHRKISTWGKAEPRPLTASRIPLNADPTAALSPITRTRSVESTTRPLQTRIVPFRTQAETMLSDYAGARHSTNDAAFEKHQHFHRLQPSGTGPQLLQESFSRSFSTVESALMSSLPASARRDSSTVHPRGVSNPSEARLSTLPRSHSEKDIFARVASTLPKSRSEDTLSKMALPLSSPLRSPPRSPRSRSGSSAGGKSTVMKQSSG